MKTLPLSRGAITVVDDDDFEWAAQYKWTLSHQGYAYRFDRTGDRPVLQLLHRLILDAGEGEHVHHKDGDKLNNQRHNLEKIAGRRHTHQHQGPQGPRKGQYKGVCKPSGRRLWLAQIGGRFIGYYETAEQAAEAYDQRAYLRWGDQAYLNFPDQLNRLVLEMPR